MYNCKRLDRVRNAVIREKIELAHVEDNMREIRLRWFAHVKRRYVDALVRRCEMISLPYCRRDQGRSKKS